MTLGKTGCLGFGFKHVGLQVDRQRISGWWGREKSCDAVALESWVGEVKACDEECMVAVRS